MKKTCIYIATTLLTAFLLTSQLPAKAHTGSTQPVKKTFNAAVLEDTSINLKSTAANLLNSSAGSMKEVKKAARAFKQFNRLTRNFSQEFSGASEVYWSKDKSGFCGQFARNGLNNVVWYSQDGYLMASMVTYKEDLLPDDVKNLVNDAYDGYSIKHIHEIRKGDILVHVVTLENEKNIKQVRVCDGVLDEYKSFRKA